MANFAALVSPLSISGSRLTDGTPNASGTVYFFQPGGNTPVNVYADAAATTIVTQPVTLGAGGKLPTQYAAGIFTTQPVRMLIQDANGTTVTDNVFIPATAGNVGVDNDGFSDSTLDDVLTDAFTSVGGTDWKYKESGGATARTIKAKFAEIWISVKDFGAVGDGVAIDTTAIQSAVNRAIALGGAVVFFPGGTYKIDAVITVSSGSGVRLLGAGIGVTVITSTHATANVFTFSSSNEAGVARMTISNSAVSTGAAIAASACLNFVVDSVRTIDDYGYGLDVSGASCVTVDRFFVSAVTRGIRLNLTASGNALIAAIIRSSTIIATDAASSGLEFNGVITVVNVYGSYIQGGTNSVLFNSAMNVGSGPFTFVGNAIYTTGVTAFQMTGLATAPIFRQYNNGAATDGYTTTVASGATVTPTWNKGQHIRIRVTSTGVAYTIAAPTPVPSGIRGLELIIDVYNNAGGAITAGSGFAANYHCTAPSLVDTEHTTYLFVWDDDSSVWREVSRSVTT